MFDFFKDPTAPENDELASLMLLGAMYVEDNEILSAIDQNTEPDMGKDELKTLLIQGFCSLDMNMEDASNADVKTLLEENWGINNKNDLINTMDYLLKEGDQKQLKQLISFGQTNLSPESRTIASYRSRFDEPLAFDGATDDDLRKTLLLAESFGMKLSSAGIRGWDIARFVHLLRLGYLAGYLKEKEAWELLKKIKEPAMKVFHSWKEFSDSYVFGRRWWSNTASSMDDACQRLLTHPKSPWTFFKWLN